MKATYFSLAFMGILLPITLLLYNFCKREHRWKILLGASFLFFFLISGKLIIYLVLSCLSIHYFGLWMGILLKEKKVKLKECQDKEEKRAVKDSYTRRLRWILALAIALHLGVLLVLKYSSFFGSNFNALLNMLHLPFTIPVPKFILPIGISFYTLQAMGYLFDVYRGTVEPERSLFKLSLFLSFFPQIIEGPICRYNETADQLMAGNKITEANFYYGSTRILYGMMKKMLVADRLNGFILEVFNNYGNYDGGVIALGMIAYTVQLYMEFSGTMDVVIGISEIMGIKMPENFRHPFFSHTISEFWTRWHISLGTWFKDYVFYPLSMSKPLKRVTQFGRKHLGNHYGPLLAGSVALLAVWLCNGLWHGSDWQYIFFGLYHFTIILLGSIVDPFSKKICERLHINRHSIAYQAMQIARTIILVLFGELFFRATSLTAGFQMVGKIFTELNFTTIGNWRLSMDGYDGAIVAIMVITVLIVSILEERGKSVRGYIKERPIYVRWAILYLIIFSIIIFGAYGPGYLPVDPIYGQF